MLKLTLTTLLLALVAAIQGANLPRSALLRAADQSLMQFMARSIALTQGNPTRSTECFQYYVPILTGVTGQYEKTYEACISGANSRRTRVDDSTRVAQGAMAASAQGACSALSACNGVKGVIEYFQCYATTGGDNTKVLYGIQANATEILEAVREEYRSIENEKTRCTTASERAYVQNTAAAYENLQSCLQGKTTVPSKAPTPPTQTTLEPNPVSTPRPEFRPGTQPEVNPVNRPEQPRQ